MFRLLSAKLAAGKIKRSWNAEGSAALSDPIEISFQSAGQDLASDTNGSHVSVLLGKNGEGKSRVLSGIATAFQLLQDYSRGGSLRGLPLERLEYLAGGKHHLISMEGKEIHAFQDGVRIPLEHAKLPSRVVALSMTPFDKFPLGSAQRKRVLDDQEEFDLYRYLGMRERMGQVSTSALLTRALEGMVSRITDDDRGRLTQVFEMLDFVPSVDVVYRLHERRVITMLAEGASVKEIFDGHQSKSFLVDRLRQRLEGNVFDVDEIRSVAAFALDWSHRSFVSFRLDLRDPDELSLRFYKDLQLLRKLGLVRLHAVEVSRKNGVVIDLKDASSGELSIAITFMSLASALENESLILVDEPECNLHPEWQARYLDLLLNTFNSYGDCHYVLATHSPLILSDAPTNATLASLHAASLQYGEEVSGKAIDYLLVEAFQVANGDNYYVQEQLVSALRLAADGKSRGAEFQSTVRKLTKIRSILSDSPGIIEIIGDLEKIARRADVK